MRKLIIDYKGRSERQQAALMLEEIRTMKEGTTVALTFCANDSQVESCEAFNKDSSHHIEFGQSASNQAKVMKELQALLRLKGNEKLLERVKFLPIVTVTTNAFGVDSPLTDTNRAGFVETFEQQAKQFKDNGTTILGFANLATPADRHMQVGGGRVVPADGPTATAYHDALDRALDTVSAPSLRRENASADLLTAPLLTRAAPAHPAIAEIRIPDSNDHAGLARIARVSMQRAASVQDMAMALNTYHSDRGADARETYHGCLSTVFGGHTKTTKRNATQGLIDLLEGKRRTFDAVTLINRDHPMHNTYIKALTESGSTLLRTISDNAPAFLKEHYGSDKTIVRAVIAAATSAEFRPEAVAVEVASSLTPMPEFKH